MVLTFESVVEILESLNIQLKVNEQYFPVVLLIMLYKVLLTFKSVDKMTIRMKTTYYAVQSYTC